VKIEEISRRAPVLRKSAYFVRGSFPFHIRAVSNFDRRRPAGVLCRLAATACGARPGARPRQLVQYPGHHVVKSLESDAASI
jgi:hypothetical protein